ncbi:SLEI family protein [Planoprotostelium fungivorum]|uniref:SLEI family protein n=1 Tax=Planoprotostelium fungivorum TaxID=1890364 RepID=A0A2P6NI08_9EUKA|nr:SLEI family protein [Planoprotostelium fungivorum]
MDVSQGNQHNSHNGFNLLSVELIVHILENLHPFDLCACRDTSFAWRSIVDSVMKWKCLPFTHSSLGIVPPADLEKLVYYNKNALLCDNNDDSSHTFQGFLFGMINEQIEEEHAVSPWVHTLTALSTDDPNEVVTSKLRQQCIEHLRKAEELNPKNIMAWMNHGYFSVTWGDYASAKRAFKTALEKFTRNEAEVSYYYNVAYTYYRLNNDNAALEYFKKSLELYHLPFKSNNMAPTIEFSAAYFQRRSQVMPPDDHTNRPVLSLLQTIISSLPKTSASSSKSVEGRSDRNNHKSVAIDIRTCRFLNEFSRERKTPKSLFSSSISLARCFNHIATSLQFLDKNDEAFEFYSKALSENYDLPNVHYGLAWLYNSNKNVNKARYHFEMAIELNPSHIHALTKLGWVHAEAGNEDTARQYFAKSLELDPNYAPAQNGMADTFVYDIALLADNMRARESIGQLMLLLEKYPKYSNGYILLGTLYFTELEEFTNALTAFKKAMELAPNKKLCYEVAKCHYVLGNYEEAKRELEEELRLIEECITSHVICHVNTNGSLKESHKRQLTRVHILMGDVHQKLGEYEKAMEHYNKAQNNSKHKTVYYGLATLHAKMENFSMSHRYFEESIQGVEFSESDLMVWAASRRRNWQDNERAIQLFHRVMSISPLHIQVHREWAEMISSEISRMKREGYEYSNSKRTVSELEEMRREHVETSEKIRTDLIGELSQVLISIGKKEEGTGWLERSNRIEQTNNFYIPRVITQWFTSE